MPPGEAMVPSDTRALVAIDLGAESCRVSLLRWVGDAAHIELVHRIPNGPEQRGEHLYWPLLRILDGVQDGLRRAAELAPEGIRSVAVDGWAVDYVRLPPAGENGAGPNEPYCYRDERTIAAKARADAQISPAEIFATTGAQPLRINTVYQLIADNLAGADAGVPWVLLPEYVLHSLGGRRVAEYTNATHTGLVDLKTGDWCRAIFDRLGLSIEAAPAIVPSGMVIGKLSGALAELPALADTLLIAPACHDTASAIAAITADLGHTAYLVSGTWSLIGTVVDRPIISADAERAGFTNQGEAAGGYCFHTNVNGMWVLKQCIDHWCSQGRAIDLPSLVAAADAANQIPGTIDIDSPPLLLSGQMPDRLNRELTANGHAPISDQPGNEAVFARVILASLAERYAIVLKALATHTGRTFEQITMLGGGSRNALLRRLTAEATGLPVNLGEAEGSTLGNFAVQLAALERAADAPLQQAAIRCWASRLSTPQAR